MPTVNIKAFSHKKSTVVENGGPKLPTAAQLELGEIAINFAKGYETLSIKNNNDEIVTFTNDNYWINKELAIAAALNDLNDRKQDALEMDETPTEGSENVVTSGGLYSYITEIEQVTAAALNDLNDRITSLALSDDYAAAAQGTPPLAGDTYETAISKLHKVIVDDELITSSALNDLNSRIDNLSLSEDYVASDPASEPAGGDTYEEAISKLHGAILENELATSAALNDLNTRISDIVVPDVILSEDYKPSSLSNEDLFLAPGDSYETAFAKLEKTINDNENITSAALTDLDSRLNLLHLPQSLDDIPDGSTRKLSDYATTTQLATKQDALVSGTNIKTINNESILGSGNITIQGGGGDTNVIETVKVNGTALTPDANKAVDITSIPASIVTQDSTHRFVSDTEKTTWNNKVSNVQADWNATSGLAQILNKPTIPNDSNLVHKTGNETIAGDKTFNGDIIIDNTNSYDIIGKFIAGPDFSWIKSQYGKFLDTTYTLQQALDERNNVQADWNQTTTTAADYIKNKPTIPAAQIQADWNQTTTTSLDYIKNKPDIKTIKYGKGTIVTTNGAQHSSFGYSNNYISFSDDGNVSIYAPYSTSQFSFNNKEVAVKDDIPTNVSAFTNDAGYLTSYTETDPTVPAWAKASTKPTYTAAEVGALPDTYTPPVTSVNGQTGAVNLTIPAAPGTLNTTATTAQSTSSSEALSGNITLHKVAKTGNYNDLLNKPTIPATVTESTVSGWGFTKNTGTITGITMNGTSKGTSGVIDLGTVLTSHQDISGKADKSAAIGSLSLSMDSTNYKITLSGTKVDGTAFTVADVIDLPLESVVVSGTYDNTTKKVVLTLKDGSTVDFSVADLVNGLQTEITSTNKLSADLIADGTTNKVVTAAEKTAWNNKSNFSGNYNDLTSKPTIPTALADLTADATHRLVTDTEKSTWNNKASSDTKNTAGATQVTLGSKEKLYLVGAKAQGNNPLTYTDSNVYLTVPNGALHAGGLSANTVSATNGNFIDINTDNIKLTGSDFSGITYGTPSITLLSVLDSKASDSNVVHKTGNETIADEKKFTGRLSFQGGNGEIIIRDQYNADPILYNSIAQDFDWIITDTTENSSGLVSGWTLQDALNSKASDNAVVHKTGSETISGEKNFNNRILLHSTVASDQEPVEGEEQENITEDTVLSGSYIYHHGHDDFSWITTSADEVTDISDGISLQSALDKKVSTSSNRLLPTVTTTNNGKILMVVNGAWALVTPTSIYSGTSEPDSNTGNNGDLYLQTS